MAKTLTRAAGVVSLASSTILLIQLILLLLKLEGFINWDWLWVIAPIWISAIPLFIAATIVGLSAAYYYIKIKKHMSQK